MVASYCPPPKSPALLAAERATAMTDTELRASLQRLLATPEGITYVVCELLRMRRAYNAAFDFLTTVPVDVTMTVRAQTHCGLEPGETGPAV